MEYAYTNVYIIHMTQMKWEEILFALVRLPLPFRGKRDTGEKSLTST